MFSINAMKVTRIRLEDLQEHSRDDGSKFYVRAINIATSDGTIVVTCFADDDPEDLMAIDESMFMLPEPPKADGVKIDVPETPW